MHIYTVKKHRGRWMIFLRDTSVLDFDDYEEAVGVAQNAVVILRGTRTHLRRPDCGNAWPQVGHAPLRPRQRDEAKQ